jgi:hypothetical protein
MASTSATVAALRSSSLLARCAVKECGRTFEMNVSTKKEMWARWIAPSGVLEGGTRCEGCASARSWVTIADSGIMVPL